MGNCRSFAVEDARHGFWGKKREGSALSKNSARVDGQMIDKRCTERERHVEACTGTWFRTHGAVV